MGRPRDSVELKELKKEITQEFISAVQHGGTKDGPKKLEKEFGIGDGRGTVWCVYRKGTKTMSLCSLRQKIEHAMEHGYITEMMASKLLSKIPGMSTPNRESYTFDATSMLFNDVKQTADILEKQIKGLRKRISYGNKELEDAHYYTTSLDLLQPMQNLIQELSKEKLAEEHRLNNLFGKENYKDIAQSTSPKNVSAWDVGYGSEWWMKSPPSADEIRLIMSDKVTLQLVEFIKEFGNDGIITR